MKAYFPAVSARSLCAFLICFSVAAFYGRAATTYYVATNNAGIDPYTSWDTAGSNIIGVVNTAQENGADNTVLVSNGTYQLTNQINITNLLALQSVNGPAAAALDGQNAVRCISISNSAPLVNGFTFTRGYAIFNGGGIQVASSAGTVSNCAFYNNCVNQHGAGVSFYNATAGTVANCMFYQNTNGTANSGLGGGLCYVNCSLAVLKNCIFWENRALNTNLTGGANVQGYGGVAIYSSPAQVQNCLFYRNDSKANGGGLGFSTMGTKSAFVDNCTFVGNTASNLGGGIYMSNFVNVVARNSIIWSNTAPTHADASLATANLTNCCIKDTNGVINWNTSGNITGNPSFMNASADNYRLQNNSPCVNAGINQNWMTNAVDLDGKSRICYGTVDMGAYECIHGGAICVFK